MRAGYMPWSHTEECELGGCSIYADLGSGNLMCRVPGMYYNSCEGWRMEAAQEARKAGDAVIWKDGTGAEHIFRRGRDADGAGFMCGETDDGIKIWDADGGALVFSADGRICEARLADGKKLEYLYTCGRLTAVAGCGMRRVFAYKDGRPAILAGDGVVFYEHSGQALAAVRFGDGAPGVVFGYKNGFLTSAVCVNERIDIEYDEFGRAIKINGAEYEYSEGHTTVRDGEKWTYTFDKAGRCTKAENGDRAWKIDGYAPGKIRDIIGI